jgi:hypothetical protein
MTAGRATGFAVVLAAAVLVTTGAAPAGSPPAPRAIKLAHHGKTFELAVGRAVSVRLSNRERNWSKPRVTGTGAVGVNAVYYYTDPGFVEWNVAARRPGRVTLTSLGRCAKCTPSVRRFRVTLVIG